MESIAFDVAQIEAGERIDRFISKRITLTRSQVKKLIEGGCVMVNSVLKKANYIVRPGDRIDVVVSPEEPSTLMPEPIPLEILFEDEYLVVVNKPYNMVVYPASGHMKGTLLNALAYHCDRLASIGGPLRPGVVHRLDKDTSGVMVIAKDDRAYYCLVEQFRKREIKRRYIAIVYGALKGQGEVKTPIGRAVSDRKRMSTRTKRGKEAVTYWKAIETIRDSTLIEVRLKTGRTHQIRVHMSCIGHPVLGDATYGRKRTIDGIRIPRQMLHADTLGFIHPITGEFLEFTSPMPPDMKYVLDNLRRDL